MKSLPIWAERLLRAICPNDLFEQIEGDLIEIYNNDVKTVGKKKGMAEIEHYCCPIHQTRDFFEKQIFMEY